MVSHNIEEVVFMADRVTVLEKNPGRIIGELQIELTHPRERKSPGFIALVDRLYTLVTQSEEVQGLSPPQIEPKGKISPMPHIGIGMLNGLIELVADRGGREDLHRLGRELLLEVDDFLPITEAAELLELAHVREGDLVLTDLGMSYAELDTLEQKEAFRRQARSIPLIALISKVLKDKRNRRMPQEFFLELLEKQFSPGEAQAQLERVIDWGRYAEFFISMMIPMCFTWKMLGKKPVF
jgi:NitT/TauT family transport system ATP-binding protein